jgi:hypothetical protein
MPYITRIHVKKCRNVRDLDIDLSLPGQDELAPGLAGPPRAFRHLILTGPNGSGKSGILEGVADALVRTLFSEDEMRRILRRNRERRRTPLDASDARLNVLQGGPSLDLAWDVDAAGLRDVFARGEIIAVYLPARRHVGRQDVRGPKELEWGPAQLNPEHELAVKLLQFLVNKQTERAFALARGDEASAERITRWFERFDAHLRRLTGDPSLRVEFDEQAYNFRFHRRDGYVFDLNTLADGHSAALSILAELLLRVEAVQRARGDFTFEPSGIVVVDEIETHLHLLLQEQILPFLTEIFPRLQIIVATHSPAVIASIPGAVVFDLGTRAQALSDHYRGIPYGMLMKDHFGISSDIDLDSTRNLLRLRKLAEVASLSDEEERELSALAAELSQRSPVLATEVSRGSSRSFNSPPPMAPSAPPASPSCASSSDGGRPTRC